HVAAGMIEAGDEAEPDWVGTYTEDNRNRVGRGFGGEGRRRAAWRCDDGHLAMDKVCGHTRQAIELILRPAIFDRNVATLDEAGFAQALTKAGNEMDARFERAIMEKPHHWHGRLLRARRYWPRCRAAKKRNEIAPPQVEHATICSGRRNGGR